MQKIAWWVGGGLIALYAINVCANAIYKAATDERADLLQERIASLTRLNPDDDRIGRIRNLIAQSEFSSFTTAIPSAISKRAALARYLNRHPHVDVGVALDGDVASSSDVSTFLRKLNQRLRRHRISLGLAQSVVKVKVPTQATREDILRGVTTAFHSDPDYHIALTGRTCRYEPSGPAAKAATNGMYSFGLRKLSFVDNAVLNNELADRLLLAIINHLIGNPVEKQWREADYSERFEEVLTRRKITGRVVRAPTKSPAPEQEIRTVPVVVGLDNVAPEDARSYLSEVSSKFDEFGIRFGIKRVYQHRLNDSWKWPLEIQRMQQHSEGELFMLLTSDEWISPKSGHVRGLGSGFFGSIMVQVGTRQQTILRLMHEIGHQFQLPHTLLEGSVMYPNEQHIGFNWSPGNRRRLKENRLSATWHSSKTYRDRFDIAIRLAPPMIRSGSETTRAQPEGFAAQQDAWVICE